MPKKQQKMASYKKMQENKPTLKVNFTWEYMWPVLILGIFCSDGQNQRALISNGDPSIESNINLRGCNQSTKTEIFPWKDGDDDDRKEHNQ